MLGKRSQHPWIQESRFSTQPGAQALIEILNEIGKLVSEGHKPTLVFDLDSTIFEVRTRTLRILKEFIRSNPGRCERLAAISLQLKPQDLLYTLEETIQPYGYDLLDPERVALRADLLAFWKERFFSSEYLLHDLPVPGSRSYVGAVWRGGAKIIYLTGRERAPMIRGTEAQLRHWGFPVSGPHVSLAMKPTKEMEDSDFKDAFLDELSQRSEVLALYDNEPANFAGFQKSFPSAKLFFRYSTCSAKPAPAVHGVIKIDDFCLSK